MEREPVDVEAGRSPDPCGAAVVANATAVDGPRDFLAAGNPRGVLQAAASSLRAGECGVLALVLETEGSTYAGTGDMVLFAGDAQVGWVSGGCLEPELARMAMQADDEGGIAWVEIDTRDDAAMLSGSALGCRGRLRIALLPLRSLTGAGAVLDGWLEGGVRLQRNVGIDGEIELQAGDRSAAWRLPSGSNDWAQAGTRWRLPLPRLPELLVLGAGPETPFLLPLVRELGWRPTLAERRSRWRESGAAADARVETTPELAIRGTGADAALVMHHDFERDREALAALAETDVAFIGLLGPPRRRDDLFKLLAPAQRARLSDRLHAPVGLDLGGRGPEAIALSIAAQLQRWRAAAAAA